MKKTVATILIALMAISCVLAFVGCKDNDDDSQDYGDPFVGAISQMTYDSVEDAVKAFLAEEISGISFTAEYVAYIKTSDLTQEEINELAINEELKDGLVSAEKGEVEYIEKSSGQIAILSDNTCKRSLYIVNYIINGSNLFRFYTPAEEVGQTPSASAWASILQYNKYYNCSTDLMILEDGEVFENIFIFSEESVYLKESWTTGYVTNYNNMLYGAFLETSANGDKVWNVVDYLDEDYDDKKISISDIVDGQLIVIFFFQCALYQGYCDFIKTNAGYRSRSEFRREEIRGDDVYSYDIFDDYNIAIANGRISEISFKILERHNTYPNDHITASGIETKVKFSNFGTAKVNIPKDAMDAIKAYVAQN